MPELSPYLGQSPHPYSRPICVLGDFRVSRDLLGVERERGK